MTGFTDRQKRELRKRLNARKVVRAFVRDASGDVVETASDLIVDRLEAIVIAAQKGEFKPRVEVPAWRTDLMQIAVACRDLHGVYVSWDEETRAKVDKMLGSSFLPTIEWGAKAFKHLNTARPRGAPKKIERFRIAMAVGWVLLTEGVRSFRAPKTGVLGGRSGPFAYALGAVLEAAGLEDDLPENLHKLITEVTPILEREAFLGD
jgi:hypothetical protein